MFAEGWTLQDKDNDWPVKSPLVNLHTWLSGHKSGRTTRFVYGNQFSHLTQLHVHNIPIHGIKVMVNIVHTHTNTHTHTHYTFCVYITLLLKNAFHTDLMEIYKIEDINHSQSMFSTVSSCKIQQE